MTASFRLDDQVAVVTGALGKLGPLWIEALVAAGARVAAIDIVDGAALEAQYDGAVRTYQADVTDRSQLERAAHDCRSSFGPPTVLVNGAGVDAPPSVGANTYRIEDVPVEEFRRVLDVNLVGTFLATQVFGAPMAEAGAGSIVNIGSLYASIAPEPRFYDHLPVDPPFLKPAAYGASKAGVLHLTRYFARLWGQRGVRVNTLSPGGIEGGQDAEFVRKFVARVPLGRLGRPDELVGCLLFLASPASSYVTGIELRADGGFTA